ncbi:MAG TPA: hypothetical protein VGR08_05325, partial [Thermomicrobiales bacterium]|nr:hypothetical protein [Thermomicrobiales bacterium]
MTMEGARGIAEAPPSGDVRVQAETRSLRDRLATKEWVIFLFFVFPNFLFLILFTYWPMWE